MKKRIYLLLFISSICTFVFAQKNKDFILTLSKDTIFGNVTLNTTAAHITFMHKRKKVYFHPKTLNSFGIYNKKRGYKYYKSITNARGTSMFVEVLNDGPIKLYKYQKKEKVANIQYHKSLYYIGRSDERLTTITPESYERTIKVLVKDYPTLLTQVEHISYQEVPNIIASLNQL